MRRVELLSPAKNVDVAIAAINNGADAVYIGGPAFRGPESGREQSGGHREGRMLCTSVFIAGCLSR